MPSSRSGTSASGEWLSNPHTPARGHLTRRYVLYSTPWSGASETCALPDAVTRCLGDRIARLRASETGDVVTPWLGSDLPPSPITRSKPPAHAKRRGFNGHACRDTGAIRRILQASSGGSSSSGGLATASSLAIPAPLGLAQACRCRASQDRRHTRVEAVQLGLQ